MDVLLDLVRQAGPWALLAVFAGAALEYMLPPLPADTVVLAGALLVIADQHHFVTVYLVAVAGGMSGAALHYAIGRRLSTPEGSLRGRDKVERITGKGSIQKFFAAFRKHGMWVIVFNRAMPGVRAVTFLAAGAARLSFGWTMLAGLASHAAWIGLILTVGVSVGESWEKIQAVFDVYQKAVYAVAGVVVLAYVGYRLVRRRRRRRSPPTDP